METMLGRSVIINEGAFGRIDKVYTDKLRCYYCKTKLEKGQVALFTYCDRKLDSVNCGKCKIGKQELEYFSEEIFHVDAVGLGQY